MLLSHKTIKNHTLLISKTFTHLVLFNFQCLSWKKAMSDILKQLKTPKLKCNRMDFFELDVLFLFWGTCLVFFKGAHQSLYTSGEGWGLDKYWICLSSVPHSLKDVLFLLQVVKLSKCKAFLFNYLYMSKVYWCWHSPLPNPWDGLDRSQVKALALLYHFWI